MDENSPIGRWPQPIRWRSLWKDKMAQQPANYKQRMKSAVIEAQTALSGESTGGISNTVSTSSLV
jgi:hypothetical protein